MGKGSSSAPKAPDPRETAAAEAQYNRVDTYNPDGSGIRYGYTGPDGKFVQGVAPEGSQSAQQALESPWAQQIRQILQPAGVNLVGSLVRDNVKNLPNAARVQNFDAMADDIFKTGYDRMKPQFEQENGRMMANLQARGIPVGSEAFGESYQQQQQGVNDALSQLSTNARLQAGQEQTRQYNLDSAERSNALSEIIAAMGGGYTPQTAQASGQASNIDISGMMNNQYAAQQSQYQQNQQNRQSTMGTIGSLGAAAIMKCTADAKDILHGVTPDACAAMLSDLPLHVWRYKEGEAPEGLGDQEHLGPMAEDFHRITGLGDGKTISVIDMLGLIAGATQHALQENADLRAENERLRNRSIFGKAGGADHG